MTGKKKRPRTLRREHERAVDKLEDARERLARLEPGGEATRPIEVSSASVVESRALGLGCARCGGALELEAHDAVRGELGPLRRVRARCRACRARREVWLRVAVSN
ncbi:MAG: hypothetical protein KF729_10295 [Sandaracinaceae bacterium]|nr:hypothetical protein [Sandaracinaceae bacterium]